MLGYIIRCESANGVSFGLRRMDRSTIGIGCRYFAGIGGAREYAKQIGMTIIGYIGFKDSRRK